MLAACTTCVPTAHQRATPPTHHPPAPCSGKYAQLFAENKAFSEEEGALFDAAAQHAYESFRDKAASSRGMSVEAMQVGS